MEKALTHLKKEVFEIEKEDKTKFSPIAYKLINALGDYSFTLSENVQKERLRPLNETNEFSEKFFEPYN